MKYLAIIGDIVASRRLPARAQFQRRLKAALETLNQHRGRALASPYTLTLGDEFQALYRNPSPAFADAFSLLASLAPVEARFAFAVGEIVTPLNAELSIGMDGPAFHRARTVLERLKAEGRLFGVQPGANPADEVTTAALNVLSSWVKDWKPNRLRLFAGLLEGRTVAELAAETRITPRAVNKNIRAAELNEWLTLLQNVTHTLAMQSKAP